MANYEATRYDYDGSNITGIEGVNTGIIVPWSDSSIPSGFLECNGQAVSRTTYADLFAVIGTTYGVGDGSTTFDLPDLQDRCCQNESPTKTIATTGGANTVTSAGNVGGSAGNTSLSEPTIASHSHQIRTYHKRAHGNSTNAVDSFIRTSGVPAPRNTDPAGGGGAHSHPLTASFTGDATSVLQPYITMVYIIKT